MLHLGSTPQIKVNNRMVNKHIEFVISWGACSQIPVHVQSTPTCLSSEFLPKHSTCCLELSCHLEKVRSYLPTIRVIFIIIQVVILV